MDLKKYRTTAVTIFTAAIAVVGAIETLCTRVDRLTNAMEQREVGPNYEEMWRRDTEQRLDSLEVYHNND